MSPRLATFLMFVVNGSVVGTWVAAIPTVKDGLGASGSEFGMALLFLPFGALVAQQVTGQLLVRASSRRILTVSAFVLPWLVVPPMVAPSLPLLAATLFVLGYANTTMDVTMNAHGVALEDRGGKSIVSGLHAGWSLGGVVGALGIALALELGVQPVAEAVVAAIVLFVLGLLASRSLGTGSVRIDGATGFHWPSRAVIPLALIIVLIAFVEGGLTDWGGVYLDLGIGAPASIAAVAYAALSLGMFVGRIGGDRVKDRVGSIRLTQWGMLLVAGSVAAFLVVHDQWVALAGMVAAGIGIANTIPQIFGAAGRIPPGGPSLSAVFTALTVAFMAGPLIIGTSSDIVGISGTFWLFVVASVAVALLISRVPVAETNPRFRR
ncbi:MAG: MFS transporter [Candidatus Limnocylindrales bacterium]